MTHGLNVKRQNKLEIWGHLLLCFLVCWTHWNRFLGDLA